MSRQQKRTIVCVTRAVVLFGLFFILIKMSFVLVDSETEPITTMDELRIFMTEAESVNSERIFSLERGCKKYNLGMYKTSPYTERFTDPPAPQYTVFYMASKYNISYCPVYKAGSTTWIYNLCLLLGVPEAELNSGREQISTIARRVMPEIEFPAAEEVLEGSNKILVVRHPFERLLSAYRDKLENSVAGREHGTLHFYRKYGARIVKKYRGENFTRPREDQVIRRKDGPGPSGEEPTFREFVRYLIDTDLANYADDHWIPYYLYCTPCIVSYDLIAKVETLWRDQVYAIRKLGLQDSIKPRWRHGSGDTNPARIYFSQLNEYMVEMLYEKYRLDFELFDYSPTIYYEYATAN